MSDQPMQPLSVDKHGTTRFKENSIVRHLLDHGGIDMNALAMLSFPVEDREQFAQLIGYSLSGFGELSYVRAETYATAYRMSEGEESEDKARIAALEEMLEEARKAIRDAVVAVFRNHPDDLHA
jgi:hypothetical protein